MTTAARPTFAPAKGGSGRGEKNLGSLSKQYSSRDLPANLKLKYRQSGQGTVDELKNKDFKRDLEERERIAAYEKESKRTGNAASTSSASRVSSITSSASKKARLEAPTPANIDADDPIEEEDSDEDSDEDEDDTAELLAELNRIKRERALEEAKKEAERKVQEEKIRMENILSGNPLLSGNNKADFKVKRRWDDDVVFKNCAKSESDKKDKPFINDTLRSEFHKKFMEKYIK